MMQSLKQQTSTRSFLQDPEHDREWYGGPLARQVRRNQRPQELRPQDSQSTSGGQFRHPGAPLRGLHSPHGGSDDRGAGAGCGDLLPLCTKKWQLAADGVQTEAGRDHELGQTAESLSSF